MEESTKYLEFLKFCLNDNCPVPECIATIKWHDLIDFGKKQAILGLFSKQSYEQTPGRGRG